MLQYCRRTRHQGSSMLKKSILVAAMALISSPAFADLTDCSEPYAPAAVDGSTASEEKMSAARKDVMTFISDSDNYQMCLNSQLIGMKKKGGAERAKDKVKKPLDPSVQADVAARLDANQKMKERVGAEYNTAVTAYQAKHPKTP